MLSGLPPSCPGPARLPQNLKQKGPTPRRSCPPGDASCAWRWPHQPPARTAASLSLTLSAGPRPGARAAGPPAAGPDPMGVTRVEGHQTGTQWALQGWEGWEGWEERGEQGTPQPCLSSPPATQQTEPKGLFVWCSGMQPTEGTTRKACQQKSLTQVIARL